MPDSPRLADWIPLAVLRRFADRFARVTGYPLVIRDPGGAEVLRSETGPESSTESFALQQTLSEHGHRLPPVAGVEAEGLALATLCLDVPAEAEAQTQAVAAVAGADAVSPAWPGAAGERVARADAVELLHLMADTLAEICRSRRHAQGSMQDLTTLFELSTLLARERDLKRVLAKVLRSVVELMEVKAAAVRLLDASGERLVTTAAHNLSESYLAKGPVRLADSELDRMALRGEVVYVKNMADDPRVLYPQDAEREGLCSILVTGLIYRGMPLGAIRIYTEAAQEFSEGRQRLLQGVAQLAAAAIRNTQLDSEHSEHERIQRQVQLAADVQRRLLPKSVPDCPPFQIAAHYEPCFEIGGDFYDFIPFEGSVGVVLGDVVGKGVAAGLLMASVRSSLRAHAEDVYDLDEVMDRVNTALCRDTKDTEFATVFYGTLDPHTMRLTYCSAGHEPTYLLRAGRFQELAVGGMVLGVDPRQVYHKGLVDLKPGDVLVAYSDGVSDAVNFDGERFGRDRIRAAIAEAAEGSARHVVNHVLWQVRRFVGLNNFPDDMTIVAARVD